MPTQSTNENPSPGHCKLHGSEAPLWFPFLFFLGVLLLIARQTSYGLDLARNQYPFSFIFYYVPAVALYVAVLWASYRSHVKGRIVWKGREYAIGAPESVK